MKMDDTPRAKSKNLDVLAEFEKAKAKNAANFVVIGMLLSPFWEQY
jgi:elongation factor 1 alpha-like protein